jgi:hypothetical protein
MDPRLHPSARGYIISLISAQGRREAEDYALMPSQEFQARFGPGFDGLERKIDEVLRTLRGGPVAVGGGPLTRAAQWMEATPTRRATTMISVLAAVAAAIATLADVLTKFIPT